MFKIHKKIVLDENDQLFAVQIPIEEFEQLEEIIEKIGSEGNYAMILEKRVGGVLYWAKPYDLTDEVIKAYDQMKGKSNE